MRGREMPGLGLGFFIAKTLLARSGAKISLKNKQFPQRGAIVRVRWKRVDFERPLIAEMPTETAPEAEDEERPGHQVPEGEPKAPTEQEAQGAHKMAAPPLAESH
jgi:hypothetical protein